MTERQSPPADLAATFQKLREDDEHRQAKLFNHPKTLDLFLGVVPQVAVTGCDAARAIDGHLIAYPERPSFALPGCDRIVCMCRLKARSKFSRR